MSDIRLWRCPDCGWTRSGEYGGKCRNAFAHRSIDAPKIEAVEYCPAADHRRALEALEMAQGEAYLGALADGDPLKACHEVMSVCVEALAAPKGSK